jgi:hypothetical protein
MDSESMEGKPGGYTGIVDPIYDTHVEVVGQIVIVIVEVGSLSR